MKTYRVIENSCFIGCWYSTVQIFIDGQLLTCANIRSSNTTSINKYKKLEKITK